MTAPADTQTPWPTDIEVSKADKTLSISFDDGETFVFSAEFLRVNSPSAEVQGHSPAERKTVPGKKSVGIIGVEEVGNYAIKIIFDDMHDSGIYTWAELYKMGRTKDELWARYLKELDAQGLSREG